MKYLSIPVLFYFCFLIAQTEIKERHSQKSAEQIMLKNNAEKIDLLELDKKRLEEAADYEKREIIRRDSIRNSKLETEIQALRDMLAVDESQVKAETKQLDSIRYGLLDDELQSLRKMLLQAMIQDSIEAQQQAQAQIEAELAKQERGKAERDSLISSKIAALDAVQADLDALEAEAATGLHTMILIIVFIMLFVLFCFLGPAWIIFNKAGQPGWAILIPIYNLIILLKIINRPKWWIALLIIPIVNTGAFIVAFLDLAKSFGKSELFGVGLILLSPIFFPILAFGDSVYSFPERESHKSDNVSIESVDSVDIIKKYKKLLDSGAITQEEYDAKKKELLDL